MRVKVLKLFGREVARIETWKQSPVRLSDIIGAWMAARQPGVEGEVPCACCGEMFDPNDPEQVEVDRKFDDLTDRIVWDAKTDDDER